MQRDLIRLKSAFEQIARLENNLPDDPTMALVHIRAMHQRLGELATIAADDRWPGFHDLVKRLIDKETHLEGQARLA